MSNLTVKWYLFLTLACIYVQSISGKKGSLCYLKKSLQQSGLCIPVTMENCSSDYIDVTSVMVYVIPTCSSEAQCGSGTDCCSPGNVTPTPDPESVIWRCTTTQCLRGLHLFDLPVTGSYYHVVEYTFNCVNDSSTKPESSTTPLTTATQTKTSTNATAILSTLKTTSPSVSASVSTVASEDNRQRDTGDSLIGVYVAVPVLLVVLVIALVAFLFIWRRRQGIKQTQTVEVIQNHSQDKPSTSANQNAHNTGGKEQVPQNSNTPSSSSGLGDYYEICDGQTGERGSRDKTAAEYVNLSDDVTNNYENTSRNVGHVYSDLSRPATVEDHAYQHLRFSIK